MINFKNKKILITGASGGIGNELVKKFILIDRLLDWFNLKILFKIYAHYFQRLLRYVKKIN